MGRKTLLLLLKMGRHEAVVEVINFRLFSYNHMLCCSAKMSMLQDA